MFRKLVIHVSNYSLGNLLVMVSGLISFPIFTRIFSVEDYGVMSLVTATLGLLVAFSKLGIQQSIIRFYAEAKASHDRRILTEYVSTTLFGMLGIAIVVTLGWALLSQLIPRQWWSNPQVGGLFLLTSVLLLTRNVDSCLSNLLRAEERSGQLNTYNVLKRYGTLGLVLLALFHVARNLYGFFGATIVAEFTAVAALLILMNRVHPFSLKAFSPKLFRRMLAFGIPMIAYEFSGIILNIGDRYVIEAKLGSGPLGVYSAAYNFCEYVQTIVLASVAQAVYPMFVRSWEEKGPQETATFIEQTLHYFLMLALPLIAGISAVGGGLLVTLASDKYASGASVIPYVAGGMAIDAVIGMAAAGLYLHKRTIVMAGLMIFGAALNIVLNLWLIPLMGINGSALATLVSYVVLASGGYYASRKLLPISFPWGSTLKFGLLSLAMYFVVDTITIGNRTINVAVQVATGVLLYALLVLIFDRAIRTRLRRVLADFTATQ
jgi:O-antigen/teichoic acid export membrane protein